MTPPTLLIIRDGWGENPNLAHASFNAVELARSRNLLPVDDALKRDWPWAYVKTSGEDVGVDDGTVGNSEVGHQNIGAGRIVDQDSVRITKAIREGTFFTIPALRDAVARSKQLGGTVHVMGLASDAGVHSRLAHALACVELCHRIGQSRVALHLFTDGRDTGPFTGRGFVADIEAELRDLGVGRIATICGRYWAMDRDHRWERVEQAYRLLTDPESVPARFTSPDAAMQHAYEHPPSAGMKGDEYIRPCVIGEPMPVRDGDTVIFFNFRGDRPRQLTRAFVMPEFLGNVKPSPDTGARGFDRGQRPKLAGYVCMTAYEAELNPLVSVAFPKLPRMGRILGEHLSALGLRQFRCAETEKYPHVTFFFNDYRDEPFPGEARENPQSPRVATYDLAPEMSAALVRDAVLRRLAAPDREHALIVNFANPDMVGHTGKLDATVQAVATVDACVGAIIDATLQRGGSLIITADHGNAEQMWDPQTNAPHTAHTTYDVPLYVVGHGLKGRALRGDRQLAGWFDPAVRQRRGRLADVAPTLLQIMGLEAPREMTGRSLLV